MSERTRKTIRKLLERGSGALAAHSPAVGRGIKIGFDSLIVLLRAEAGSEIFKYQQTSPHSFKGILVKVGVVVYIYHVP